MSALPLAARAATIDLRRTSNMTGQDPSRSFAPAARDIGAALGFFTRMPVGANASAPLTTLTASPGPRRSRGATVGLVGALALALTGLIGLPHFIRAGLATAALVAATGALHEDGLADVADGFGGGATRAIKLDIMRDSRIGAYGAIALTLALILRVAALSAALDGGFWRASISLIAVAALSRAGALTPLALLEPARRRRRRGGGPARPRRARRRMGLGPGHRAHPRPRFARPRPRRRGGAGELRSRLGDGRARAPRDRRPDRRRRRRSPSRQPRSPPGAGFSSGRPPPK